MATIQNFLNSHTGESPFGVAFAEATVYSQAQLDLLETVSATDPDAEVFNRSWRGEDVELDERMQSPNRHISTLMFDDRDGHELQRVQPREKTRLPPLQPVAVGHKERHTSLTPSSPVVEDSIFHRKSLSKGRRSSDGRVLPGSNRQTLNKLQVLSCNC